MRALTLFALAVGLSIGFVAAPSPAPAAQQKESGTAQKEAAAPAPGSPALNKCGCYEDSGGACHCAKKNQCGCPGECEPAGCEEKRQKQLAKETEQELKAQQQEDKKRSAELAKKREELDKKDAEKRERTLRGLRLIEQK